MTEDTSHSPAPVADPIDPTTTAAWSALEEHDDHLEGSLREWFAADPERAARLTHDAADLHVDLSKNLVTPETVDLLLDLGRAVGLEARRDAMFAGTHLNTSEDRAAAHRAAVRPAPSPRSRSTGRTSTTTSTRSCGGSTPSRTPCAPAPGPA